MSKHKNTNTNIPRHVYAKVVEEFQDKKGILIPIYVDRVIESIHNNYMFNDDGVLINKVMNLMNGHESCTNRVVGYFAALPVFDPLQPDIKYSISMSFCAPIDYYKFNRTFAKFSAIRKAFSKAGFLAHCVKPKQVIFNQDSFCPIYYFTYGHTVFNQYERFIEKCNKYYK